ncbi:MAG: PfkB family carbohydrate kinase [Geminicoccaceae bacterium]
MTDIGAGVRGQTAAGDSFNAGYLSARLAGAEPDAAAAQGHRIAARVIVRAGAIIPADAMADLMPDAS